MAFSAGLPAAQGCRQRLCQTLNVIPYQPPFHAHSHTARMHRLGGLADGDCDQHPQQPGLLVQLGTRRLTAEKLPKGTLPEVDHTLRNLPAPLHHLHPLRPGGVFVISPFCVQVPFCMLHFASMRGAISWLYASCTAFVGKDQISCGRMKAEQGKR